MAHTWQLCAFLVGAEAASLPPDGVLLLALVAAGQPSPVLPSRAGGVRGALPVPLVHVYLRESPEVPTRTERAVSSSRAAARWAQRASLLAVTLGTCLGHRRRQQWKALKPQWSRTGLQRRDSKDRKTSVQVDSFLNLVLASDRGTSSVFVRSCDTVSCPQGSDHSPVYLRAESPALSSAPMSKTA